jgi:uncharacterized protein (DUF58 family)
MALTTAELFKKAKKIEIASRRLVDEQLAGQYSAVFKGRGLVFSDVRPYYAGDDVRAIDWNITARMNAPHVKQFIEERDRTVNLVIDMSASGHFGSRGTTKRELAAELAAVVAFSAIKNNDRVGLFIITDKIERYVPPKKGRRHVLRVIGEILAFEPTSRKTDLAKGLDFLGKVAKRRSVVFLVSDFLSNDWERAMRITAKRHELVPVVVGDPLEHELPPVGLVVLEDLETGEVVEVDTTSHARSAFAKAAKRAAEQRDQTLRRINLDVVTATTNEPYVDALIAFFKARAKRSGR